MCWPVNSIIRYMNVSGERSVGQTGEEAQMMRVRWSATRAARVALIKPQSAEWLTADGWGVTHRARTSHVLNPQPISDLEIQFAFGQQSDTHITVGLLIERKQKKTGPILIHRRPPTFPNNRRFPIHGNYPPVYHDGGLPPQGSINCLIWKLNFRYLSLEISSIEHELLTAISVWFLDSIPFSLSITEYRDFVRAIHPFHKNF